MFDQFGPVWTSFDKSRLVYKSFDTFQDTIVYGIMQLWLSTFFRGGSLLLPTSVLVCVYLDPSLKNLNQTFKDLEDLAIFGQKLKFLPQCAVEVIFRKQFCSLCFSSFTSEGLSKLTA